MTAKEVKIKERIEIHLLEAMTAIDRANNEILSLHEKYDPDYNTLAVAKGQIKKTLQKNYDALARSRN